MSHETIDYFEILHAKGYRVTPQRVVILDAVCEGNGHTIVGEIYARAKRMDPAINRSTLYRTLDLFQQIGLVVSAEIGTGEKVYEVAESEAHYHLICRGCGHTEIIDHALIHPLFKKIEQRYRFTIQTDHHVIFGMCAACQQNDETRRKQGQSSKR